MRSTLKTAVSGVAILALTAGSDAWRRRVHAARKPAFREAIVQRGDGFVITTATETLEPEEVG